MSLYPKYPYNKINAIAVARKHISAAKMDLQRLALYYDKTAETLYKQMLKVQDDFRQHYAKRRPI